MKRLKDLSRLYRKEVGERIKEERLKIGLSQEKFAEEVELSKQTINNLENGLGSLRIEHLYQIASVCSCDIGYLLGEYDKHTYKAQYVCDMTGLDEEASNNIVSINNDRLLADSFLNDPALSNDYFKLLKNETETYLFILNTVLKGDMFPLQQIKELVSFINTKNELEKCSWYDSVKDYSGHSVEEVINILEFEGLNKEELERIELLTHNYFDIINGFDEMDEYLKYKTQKEFNYYLDEIIKKDPLQI